MEPFSTNGFGFNTYWNRPISRGRSKRPSRSLSPTHRASSASSTSIAQGSNRPPGFSEATVPTSTVPTTDGDNKVKANPSTNLQRSHGQGFPLSSRDDTPLRDYLREQHAEFDKQDDKAMVKLMKSTLPQFSNEHDWEMAAFELTLVLDRVWPHKQALDISEYLRTTYSHFDRDMEKRADSMIYFALTLSAKKDSFAKLQILAASHPKAIPCVLPNEGKKLFQMFQALFTMTIHHTANLPSMRKQFHDITQTDSETVLEYTSRVDIIVATMAKLGEQVSPGAWIYALGNGLRAEYTDTKEGILYSKNGYENVLSVKSKILQEEAILKDKRASTKRTLISQKAVDDEIAMKVLASKPTKIKPTVDQAQIHKGKGGKKGGMKGQRDWAAQTSNSTDQWATWQQPPSWTPSAYETSWTYPSSKGKGKATPKIPLWCDIHQAYGHSTDWCFDNPNKSGGPPKQEWGSTKNLEWCDNHQVYGHSTGDCRKGQNPPSKGVKGGKGKFKSPNRSWKSENFPANYDQATPVLPVDQKEVPWWDVEEEISSVCIAPADACLATVDNEELDEATASLLDLHFLSIIQQQERQQQFTVAPTIALRQEIATHAQYMTFAYSLLEPTQQEVVIRFQQLIDNAPHIYNLGQTDMNGTTTNEQNECDELARTDMNGREPNAQSPPEDFRPMSMIGSKPNEQHEHNNWEPTSVIGFQTNEQKATTNELANAMTAQKPSPFSPRDRDICTNLPLGEGSIPDGVGQASADGEDKSSELFMPNARVIQSENQFGITPGEIMEIYTRTMKEIAIQNKCKEMADELVSKRTIEFKTNEQIERNDLVRLSTNRITTNEQYECDDLASMRMIEFKTNEQNECNDLMRLSTNGITTNEQYECDDLASTRMIEFKTNEQNECNNLVRLSTRGITTNEQYDCDDLASTRVIEFKTNEQIERNDLVRLITNGIKTNEQYEGDDLVSTSMMTPKHNENIECKDLGQSQKLAYDMKTRKLPPFSLRDRDICANPPLGEGSVPDGAGQANADGKDRHPHLTNVIFMTQDFTDNDYNIQLMHEIDEENDLMEIDEQRQREHEMLQDDIIRQLTAETEQIIAAFENLDNGDSDDNPEYYDQAPKITAESYRSSSSPFSDDLNENTDTEDGAEDVIELMQANRDGTNHMIDLLRTNMKLLDFVSNQRITITRLRARIVRMGEMIQQLTLKLDRANKTRDAVTNESSSSVLDSIVPDFSNVSSPQPIYYDDGTSMPAMKRTNSKGLVLMDSNPDVTLSSISSTFNPKVHLEFMTNPKIYRELKKKQATLLAPQDDTAHQLWMYFDSGASRSVISTTSPIRKHLSQPQPVNGSCSIGDGTPLEYIEKGVFNSIIDTTVVQNLRYDLFSSVSAAKQGLTSVIDYDIDTGENNSYMVDKITGNIIPLIERGQGILEVSLQLVLPRNNMVAGALTASESILYTFDILQQLNERERDFLIHARLGHAPKRTILQMKHNGSKGLELYSGKYDELCKPCLQAKHKAENHGNEHTRHPQALPGQHLHSDLAIVSTLDANGNKYVLTVIDEISSEIVIALLKTKTAESVLRVCQKIQRIIGARTGNKLLTWQFDRGSEFLNFKFDNWLLLELGVKQLFSNVEHPWENGKAERSFQTIFALARSLLKHADLPNRMWGKAILHAAYIMNRTPVTRTGGIAPLQYRTKAPIDLSHMRVFGSPAQIHVRATVRSDKKLSDRSVSGTFIGHSLHGNGYNFLIRKTMGNINQFEEIDSADAKFNETFSPHRERQGKLASVNEIAPDLTTVPASDSQSLPVPSSTKQGEPEDGVIDLDSPKDPTKLQYGRGLRKATPRQFLIPGTNLNQSKIQLEPLSKPVNNGFQIRDQQYANLIMNVATNEHVTFLMACLESQRDDITLLTAELELLMGCS